MVGRGQEEKRETANRVGVTVGSEVADKARI